jgi:uncharacterized protein with PIN domain
LSANQAPRFVADVMVGRLARWLRALGYDTLYHREWNDDQLAHIARAENRILLTRDVELTHRRGVHAILIHDDTVMNQLQQLIQELGLHRAAAFTRCIECNAELVEFDKKDAADLVPPYVLQTQEHFRRCPLCRKVYWRGTHWQRMSDVLRRMESGDGR